MKRILYCILFSSAFFAQAQNPAAIIPQPVSLRTTTGSLTLPRRVAIEAPGNAELSSTTALLRDRLTTAAARQVTLSAVAPTALIRLVLNAKTDAQTGTEGYRLSVTPKNIIIKANTPAGIFYGVQTLLQLLPKAIEAHTAQPDTGWQLPCVEITDYPRFGWRGLMFDVTRHFFTKKEVMNFIDNMVRYKYNLLHLHLSDDEGWRIEIKGLPRLTEVGAWRAKRVGYFGYLTPPAPNEPRDYGGFYTQDDIREIVQYAKERFVNILPEIDMPGHSLAAVASYPWLSCTPGAENYVVRSGEQIMDWSHGAPPIALVDNTLCPANERVYGFVDTVVTQLAQLFPFEYIHLGGDECPKNFWQKMPEIKVLMDREGLKTMEEVQSYFEKRVEKIVESKGKKFIGWDEILEGGLAPGAAVMSWRGVKGGIAAAQAQHEVVMSPTDYAYLDYMQGDSAIESRVYAALRLNKAYQFDPLPAGVDPKYIKGGQANIWTEQIYNERYLEYMLWPRALAIAECLWSPLARKDWNDFTNRVAQHFQRFDMAEIRYAPSMYEPIFTITRGTDQLPLIQLATEVQGLDIYYSFDNSFPDRFYPKYTTPLTIPKDAAMLKVAVFRGKQQVGRYVTMSTAEIMKRAAKAR